MSRTKRRPALALLSILSVLTLVATITPAGASGDPLGVSEEGPATANLSTGLDLVAVWLCQSNFIPGDEPARTFTAQDAADWGNDHIAPYFDLISRGRYEIRFEAAGTLPDVDPGDCLTTARARTSAPYTNVFAIDDSPPHGIRSGGAGGIQIFADRTVPLTGSPSETGRGFFTGGLYFEGPGGVSLDAGLASAVGYSLGWPKSGSTDDVFDQSDNPVDLASGAGVNNECDRDGRSAPSCHIIHTIAFNRYMSGWIDRDEIAVVTRPATIELDGPEVLGGTQMAIVPSADPLIFTTIEARPAVGYDLNAGFEGVAFHTIDQTHDCGAPICHTTARRQFPAFGEPESTDHVLQVGESAVIHGAEIRVVAQTPDGYSITVGGAPSGCAMGPNRFVDLATTSFAFDDVGCLRVLGITTGTSDTTYGPGDRVTRDQMSAFLGRLYRALGGTCDSTPAPFTDIVGSFAANDVACIFNLEVTTGTSDTTYGPSEPVTREQMAAFLGRLWRAVGNVCPGGAAPFEDTAGSFAEDDISCLFSLGITTGSTDTTYDPSAPVTREQMAAFLARFWRAS